MDLSKVKVMVTKHVAERVAQRFGNKFRKYLDHKHMLQNLIIGQVSNGENLTDWKRVPFFRNSQKPGTEIVRMSGVYYICLHKPELNTLTVLTAVPQMLYYPAVDSVLVATRFGARWTSYKKEQDVLHSLGRKEYRKRHGCSPKEDWLAREAVIEAARKAALKTKPVVSEYEKRLNYLLDQLDIAEAALRRKPLHWPNQQWVEKLKKQLDEHEQSGNIDSTTGTA